MPVAKVDSSGPRTRTDICTEPRSTDRARNIPFDYVRDKLGNLSVKLLNIEIPIEKDLSSPILRWLQEELETKRRGIESDEEDQDKEGNSC